jgi:hypothetical protein
MEFGALTPTELELMIEAHDWREERRYEQLAWLAYHSLLPWLGKDSKLTPADLLKKPDSDTAEGPRQALTAEEARAELEQIKREMGVD